MNRTYRILTLALLLSGISASAVAQSVAVPAPVAPATAAAPASSAPATVSADALAETLKTAGESSNVIHHVATPLVQPPVFAESASAKSTLQQPAFAESASSAPSLPEPVPPAHPATPAQIREFLNLTHAAESVHVRISENLKRMRASSPASIPASFWDDAQHAMMTINIADLCIPVYQKFYSQEDMAATLAFYRSPAGRRMVAAEPSVATILNQAMTEAGVQVGEKIGLKYKDQLEKLKSQPPSSMDVVVTSN